MGRTVASGQSEVGSSGPAHVADELQRAWNARDVAAYASLFADDAVFVNVNGWVWFGRQDIQNRHARSKVFQTVHSEIRVRKIRRVAPDIAAVQVIWTDTNDPRDPMPRWRRFGRDLAATSQPIR